MTCAGPGGRGGLDSRGAHGAGAAVDAHSRATRGRPIETFSTPTGEPGSSLHDADLELARSALAGDPASRDALAERLRCVPRFLAVRNAALGRPLRDEDLADLAQDVLVLLWTKLPGYAGRGSLETWTYRFCVLEILNRLRSLRRGPRVREALAPDAPDDDPSVEYDAAAGIAEEETEALLRHLSAREAEVVRLRHFAGLEADEVAARLELSLSSVKTYYYRALEKLRPLLAARAEEERR